jgi:leucyl-tRNA synthetase
MDSIKGCYKFLERVWNLSDMLTEGDTYSPKFEAMMHKAVKKVSSDIEEMKYNTSIATFMTMINEFYKEKTINKAEFKTFLELLNPFAPHITEELYEKLNTGKTISASDWPKFDEAKTIDNEIELPVQLNGKLKLTVKIALDADEQEVKDIVHKEAASLLDGKNVVKEIYVKNKIYNIVIK